MVKLACRSFVRGGKDHFLMSAEWRLFSKEIIVSVTLFLPVVVDSGCRGDVSGMLHRDSLPAESPWISSLWKGSRRPKKNRVTGGQISSWTTRGEKKDKSAFENLKPQKSSEHSHSSELLEYFSLKTPHWSKRQPDILDFSS